MTNFIQFVNISNDWKFSLLIGEYAEKMGNQEGNTLRITRGESKQKPPVDIRPYKSELPIYNMSCNRETNKHE